MKQNNILWTMILLGMSLLTTQAWGQAATETKSYVINYRPDKAGCAYIDVRLTPDIIVPFMIDTGSSQTVISDKLAKRLGLTPKPALDDQGKPMTFYGEPVKYVTVQNMQIGPLVLAVNCIVLKTSQLANTNDGPANEKVDGIIGCNILQFYTVLFDFRYHAITLWQTDKMTQKQRDEIGMSGAIAVPLVSSDATLFQVDGTIDNQEKVTFLLDTGDYSTVCITNQTAQKLRLKPSKRSIMDITTLGKIKFDVSRLETLSFGSLVFKDLDAEYPHKPIDYTSQLGMGVLSKYYLLVHR